jgi:hypothetical protein
MWGSRGIGQCVIHLGSKCRWVVNFMLWLLYAIGNSLCYPLNRRMGDPKEIVSMLWRRERSSTHVRNGTMFPPLSSMYLIHYMNWATPALLHIFCLVCHPSYRFMFVLQLYCWPWKVILMLLHCSLIHKNYLSNYFKRSQWLILRSFVYCIISEL